MTLVRHDLNISRTGFIKFLVIKKKTTTTLPLLYISVFCLVVEGINKRNVYCMAKDGSHLESDFLNTLLSQMGTESAEEERCPKWKAAPGVGVSNASPPNDFFLTFGHVADPSVLACFPAQFQFLEGVWRQERKRHHQMHSLSVGPWASGFIPWCFG